MEHIPECLPISQSLRALEQLLKPPVNLQAISDLVTAARTEAAICQDECMRIFLSGGHVYTGNIEHQSIEDIEAEYKRRIAILEGYARISLGQSFAQLLGGTLLNHETGRATSRQHRSKFDRLIENRHTLRDHVCSGTFQSLSRRFIKGGEISFESSCFPDPDTAEWAIATVVAFHHDRILKWLSVPHPTSVNEKVLVIRPDLSLGRVIGQGLSLSDDEVHPAFHIHLMLVRHPKAPKGFFVKTAYPVAYPTTTL